MPFFEKIITVIPFLYLQILPVCILVLLYLFSLLFRNKRIFIYLSAFTVSLFSGFISFHKEGGGSVAFGYACFLLSLALLLSPLLLLCVRRKNVREKKKSSYSPEKIRADYIENTTSPAPSAPKAIIPQEHAPMPVNNAENDSVQLSHVFQVLKKLQSVKLSAGDRLETDVIYNMLNVYQAKEFLSAEETHALNNYLATLLKLMSKYSI